MNASVAQCRHLLSQSGAILSDLTDAHLAVEPMPGTKTAGWLMGHLALTGDFGRRLCGRPPICPVEWRPLFNPGTKPLSDRAAYPSMLELRSAFSAIYTDLAESAATADPQLLARENPFVPARETFPTSGDFVAYLLAGHLAYHLGQLVAWRAASGLARPARLDPFAT